MAHTAGVCELTPPLRLDLPLDPKAPAIARAFVRQAVCEAHHASVLDEAELLVSEVVTNGVRYGGPPIQLRITCAGDDSLKVAVSDGSAEVPTTKDADDDAESGRGMSLVDWISDSWGVEANPNGKTVWFVLRGEDQPVSAP